MLTIQEIFDKVSTHLLAQMDRSVSALGTCQYRGVNGMKCAVGAVILDEFYDRDFEGCVPSRGDDAVTGWDKDFHAKVVGLRLALKKSGVRMNDEATVDLLQELQHIHDRESPQCWRLELRRLGRHLKLNTDVLNEG